MHEPGIQRPSAAWLFFVRASFAVAALAVGIYFLPADPWVKGYLGMGALFVVGSAFTLAKTLRDSLPRLVGEHEAQRLINRVHEAKAERLLHDLDGEVIPRG